MLFISQISVVYLPCRIERKVITFSFSYVNTLNLTKGSNFSHFQIPAFWLDNGTKCDKCIFFLKFAVLLLIILFQFFNLHLEIIVSRRHLLLLILSLLFGTYKVFFPSGLLLEKFLLAVILRKFLTNFWHVGWLYILNMTISIGFRSHIVSVINFWTIIIYS